MEQKNYKEDYRLEIINILLKGRMHVRGIAKKLEVNHMIISRKMQELFNENVVNFKQEGKNKVFFIKGTEEARNYVFITEQYKLLKVLSKYPLLRNIIEKIQKDKRIKLAILFGSYAKGLADEKSDVDIFIESNNRGIKKELSLLDSELSIKIGKYDKNNNLIKEIEKNHVIIKGVSEYYEKNKFLEEAIQRE
ncbi:MAG: nucleotidyltransferase domain-containing protein [Nanoarchaeota archaeon]